VCGLSCQILFVNMLSRLGKIRRFCSSHLGSASLKIPSARLTLHSTKLCTNFKIFRKKIFFGTKVTFEALLSSSQNLKVTRLQGCTKTKLWTCWRNFGPSRSFERFLGVVHGLAALQSMVWPKLL
jgi:hypothetical protein